MYKEIIGFYASLESRVIRIQLFYMKMRKGYRENFIFGAKK